MLKVYVEPIELYNSATEEFVSFGGGTLCLEHSLISLSKWESKWHKPFLDPKNEKTTAELMDYVRCMTINTPADDSIYSAISVRVMDEIKRYMDDAMTATTINRKKGGRQGRPEVITAEIIYYWMIQFGIPVEFEKWHLNRLLTLISVCDIKGGKPEKMSRRDVMMQNSMLNAARRKRSGSRG